MKIFFSILIMFTFFQTNGQYLLNSDSLDIINFHIYVQLLTNPVVEHPDINVKSSLPAWNNKNQFLTKRGRRSSKATTIADVESNTINIGYTRCVGEGLEITLWYQLVSDTDTGLPEYQKDVPDNLFTCRILVNF